MSEKVEGVGWKPDFDESYNATDTFLQHPWAGVSDLCWPKSTSGLHS